MLPRLHFYACPSASLLFFFFNDTPTTEIYTLSLHDALPISERHGEDPRPESGDAEPAFPAGEKVQPFEHSDIRRSEEHTSELQSRGHLVCRLLLEKKKTENNSA